MAHTGIAVIESGWWRKSNVSVRGLFDLVANIACENPNSYHYEMTNSEVAIKEAIPRIGSYRECKYLCIAAHGDYNGISLLNNDVLSRAELRNILVRIKQTNGSTLRGIYLGSCLVGTESFADFLFEKEICVSWIAGYTKEVDWLDSSATDLLFFNELLNREEKTETARIEAACKRLLKIAPGLIKELGFGVYTRGRAKGGSRNLLQAAYGPE